MSFRCSFLVATVLADSSNIGLLSVMLGGHHDKVLRHHLHNTRSLLILRSRVKLYFKRNFHNHKQGSIAHSLSISSAHPPGMTEILLKRTKIASHPAITTLASAGRNQLFIHC